MWPPAVGPVSEWQGARCYSLEPMFLEHKQRTRESEVGHVIKKWKTFKEAERTAAVATKDI